MAITVDSAPDVSLSSPAAGASFTAPANIPLAAGVADATGTIARVDFYQGATLITSVTAAPYSFTWTGVPAGSYRLTAVAVNDAGQATTSTAVAITVKTGGAQMYFIHPDQLNTPRAVSDSSGAVLWKWDQTEPFGDSTPNSDPGSNGSSFDMALGFAGQYRDRETGTFYNYYRDYYPAVGRYVESDPIGLRAGLNTYAYVLSNPLTLFDPRGLVATPCGAKDCKEFKLCHYDGGTYNKVCRDGRGAWEVCTVFSTCHPFLYVTSNNRCPEPVGGVRG